MGFLAQITVQGKMFLRKLISGTKDWDKSLPAEHRTECETWQDSLKDLRCLQIPRRCATEGLSAAVKEELHIFCDASEQVIPAVVYLTTESSSAVTEVKFVIGKAKVSPIHSHTIPHLELCTAVLATELYTIVKNQLDTYIDKAVFYSDSKVALG
ncbi:Hypothetical predicted protein [Mytilus galloprovincialis]|uniref:Reverse transcriptase/retrotransposon-derived protein RNase H-like domain-containing protein n=1 Tax=Mytilus galloprovincialis TaxID=29158 RepID=A0A8B6F218_MYTGA|nr:Hypothetical predicted protein [Mytilus galloprovincialis]